MLLSNRRRSAALSRSLACALTVLAVATASCSSMHQVPVVRTDAGQALGWQVQAGDFIRIGLRDGGSAQFTVQRVTPDAIIANDGTSFENSTITSVQRREHSSGKTAGAVGGGIGVLLIVVPVVAFWALLSALGGGGGTPN